MKGGDMPEQEWHLDKRVPIAMILALVLQVGAAVYWASKMESRIEANTARIEIVDRDLTRIGRQMMGVTEAANSQAIQMGRIEEQITGLRGDIARLVTVLEREGP